MLDPWVAPPSLPLLLGAALLATLVLARPLSRVGLTLPEVVLLAAAPLVAFVDVGVLKVGMTVIAVNGAGFLIPLLISAKVVIEGRAPLFAVVGATAVVTLVSYLSSYADPGRGIMLHYQAPALACCGVTLLLVRSRFDAAGPVAFTSGSMGVVVGADVFRVPELMSDEFGQRIVVGGAGVLDGIFLVGILGMFLVVLAYAVWTPLERMGRRAPAPAELPPVGPSAPGPAPARGASERTSLERG